MFKLIQPDNRIHGIDFLRGLAVLAVILSHISQKISPQGIFLREWIPTFLHTALFKSGYYGVSMFFVISGFLITLISLQRWGSIHKISIKNFYLYRFARIAPNLIILIVALSLFHLFNVPGFRIDNEKTNLGRALLSAITFHVNWLESFVGGLPLPWNILWSLSVEETFYLFFPIACVALKRGRFFILFLGVFIVLGPFARTTFSENQNWLDHSYLSGMDGIALGCIAAGCSKTYKISRKCLMITLWLGSALVISSFLLNSYIYQLGLGKLGLNVTLLEIGTALLLISVVQLSKQEKNQLPHWLTPICQFGRNSYEIYLTHLFVIIPLSGFFTIEKAGNLGAILGFLILIGLSFLLGEMISRFFSEPLNRIIRGTCIKQKEQLNS